jgi:hypothetical protein
MFWYVYKIEERDEHDCPKFTKLIDSAIHKLHGPRAM